MTSSSDTLVASILGGDKAAGTAVKRDRSQDVEDDESGGQKKSKVEDGSQAKEEEFDDEEEMEEEEKDEDAINLVESAPRIKIHTLDTVESCTHEVAVPPGKGNEYFNFKIINF